VTESLPVYQMTASVVAEDAERVGCPASVGVDVVDVVGDRRSRSAHRCSTAGTAGSYALHRRGAGVVLGGHDEDAVDPYPATVYVNESLVATTGEPHLDAVPGSVPLIVPLRRGL
jgi:hypothetical protein